MTGRPGFRTAPIVGRKPSKPSEAASDDWLKAVAEKVNDILSGKLNNVATVTMVNGAASTTIKDARIGPYSHFGFQPLTTHAALLLWETPYVIVTSQKAGEATFAHANTANLDQTFNLTITG